MVNDFGWAKSLSWMTNARRPRWWTCSAFNRGWWVGFPGCAQSHTMDGVATPPSKSCSLGAKHFFEIAKAAP